MTSAALAADMPPGPAPIPPPVYVPAPPQPFSWTGIYVGANGGYGFAAGTLTAAGVTGPASSLSGFAGGGQIGGNYQFGFGVIGLEADFDATSQNVSYSGFGATVTEKIPWEGSVRARIGAAYDRLLVYVTAGAGYGEFTAVADVPGFGSAGASKSSSALVAGAGVEVAITAALSARLEYLYLDSGNVALGSFAGTSISGRIEDSMIRGGVNFRFPVGQGAGAL